MKKRIILMLLTLSLIIPLVHVATADEQDYNQLLIENRIKPVGQVNIQGQTTGKTVIQVAPVQKTTVLSGVDIYNKYCVACHSTGLAGAPRVHNQQEWAGRKPRGIDSLAEVATKGINAMPPKGTCSECTLQQLKSAIEYMISPE